MKGLESKGSEGVGNGDWDWESGIGEEKSGIDWEFGDEQ